MSERNYSDDAETNDVRVIVWALQDLKESLDSLVEQQRIANLIAAVEIEIGPYRLVNNWPDAWQKATEEIKEVLGL